MPTAVPLIITRYDYESQKLVSPGVHFDKNKKADRSLTNQADMDAADINKIMARYERTGVLIDPLGVERRPMYGDFTEIKDYHQMLSSIRNVERAFSTLPANVRNRFDNDPQKLIDFLDDPKNNEEAIKLGLIEQPPIPNKATKDADGKPVPAEPANPPTPPPAGSGQPSPAA